MCNIWLSYHKIDKMAKLPQMFDELQRQYEAAQEKVWKAERDADKVHKQMVDLAIKEAHIQICLHQEELGLDEIPHEDELRVPLQWDCENEINVLGTCVYDEEYDPCWDCCLFCCQSYERK